MSSDLDPYLHAYACECFGWKCFICNEEAMDQIGIEEQFLADGYVVFTDSLDHSKWVFCTTCRKPFHLKCVTTQTEHQVKLKGWPFICTFNECQGKKIKQVTPPTSQTRSTNWVTKRGHQAGQYFRTFFLHRMMAKQKFSKKGKGGGRSCRPQNRRKMPCPIRARVIRPGRSQTWTRQRNFGRPTRLKPRKISCP